MNYKRDEKWIATEIRLVRAYYLTIRLTGNSFRVKCLEEPCRRVGNNVKYRGHPIIKLRVRVRSREFSKHVRAIIGDCADSFYASSSSFRGLPNIKYSRSVESPPGISGGERVGRERGRGCREKDGDRLGLETANLKIAISALFIASLSPFLKPSDSGNGALDRLPRQIGEIYRPQERPLVRRIVLPCHNAKSRFSLSVTRDGGNRRASF